VPADLGKAVAIAADDDSLALKEDGTVVAWGDKRNPSREVPAGLRNVAAIASSFGESLALLNNGTMVAWGEWSYKIDLGGLNNLVAISVGPGVILALRSDGTIVGIGTKSLAQGLADSTSIQPPTVPPERGVTASVMSNVAGATGGAGFVSGNVGAGAADQNTMITIDLKIESIDYTGRGAVIRFHTVSGRKYSVEYSPDLSPDSWLPLPDSAVSGDGTVAQVTDTNAAAAPIRFYRLRLVSP
jgi:hypothetical protein